MLTPGDSNRTVELMPLQLLDALATFTVVVEGVEGPSGNALASSAYTFSTTSTVDLVPATVVASDPADGATEVPAAIPEIFLRFTEPVSAPSVNAASLRIGNGLAGTYTVAGDEVRFQPAAPFPTNTLIRVWVSGVTDRAGNRASGSVAFTVAPSPVPLPGRTRRSVARGRAEPHDIATCRWRPSISRTSRQASTPRPIDALRPLRRASDGALSRGRRRRCDHATPHRSWRVGPLA